MSYNKPLLCVMGTSVKAIQGQPGVNPSNKTSTLFQDAPPYQLSHKAATIGAYEADE